MIAVYFFCDSSSVRVPFINFTGRFSAQCARFGGVWDAVSGEFNFRQNFNVELFSKSFPGFVCVRVDENSPVKFSIYGLSKLPWKNIPENDTSDYDNQQFSENNHLSRQSAAHQFVKPQSTALSTTLSTTRKLISIQPDNHPFSFPHQPSLPEKFSDHWRGKLDAALRSRKYSPQTQKSYIYYNTLLCRTLGKSPEEIRPDDITEFVAFLERDNNYSASSMNIAISAIKFFFRNVLKNDLISEQHRPRCDERLPMILSKDEVVNLLGLEKNPKHRLLLMLVYSSGLRVSEVVSLKKEHIDLSRRVIYVRQGKGRKDRSTLLSEKAAQFLQDYYNFFTIDKWLFPGQTPNRPLTIRSAQHIFEKAIRRAGITKRITIHGLRHTFATHLLESGTDIRYIQTLLGHANLRTTERYTHVAQRNILKIKSPLDTL